MFAELLSNAGPWLDLPKETDWRSVMPGVEVCCFTLSPPSESPVIELPPILAVHHYEALFCRGGSLELRRRDGSSLRAKGREVLLLSDLSSLRLVQVSGELEGVLVSVDSLAARGSLRTLCSLLGNLQMDTRQVAAQLASHGGSAVLRPSPWNDAVFAALEDLSPDTQGHYCTLKAVELLYLLCGPTSLLSSLPGGYQDPYLVSQVRQIHDFMLEHLGEPLTIYGLACQFRLSATSFKSCFRQLYGQPVHRWLQRQRMNRAAELLATTDLPVGRVAELVGYGSASQFSAVFKRQYQLAPSSFRRVRAEKNV